jgi:proline iminopeptidase
MYAHVHGARLFFDVAGAGLVPDGAVMRARPTVILLHGGPGFDHSGYKPIFDELTDTAQLVYYDHRGQGRSDRSTPDRWNLAQWADDLRGLCDVLGIERPIIFGQSFGGMVAMAYAARHPEHPGKLVFSSTSARMDYPRMYARFGAHGAELGAIARAFWSAPSAATWAPYVERALPAYQRTRRDPLAGQRTIETPEVLFHFAGGEQQTMDLHAGLARVRCPTLVLGGEDDPVCPIETQEAIAAALPPALTRFERFAGCGHGVYRDDPARAFALLRAFIAG